MPTLLVSYPPSAGGPRPTVALALTPACTVGEAVGVALARIGAFVCVRVAPRRHRRAVAFLHAHAFLRARTPRALVPQPGGGGGVCA